MKKPEIIAGLRNAIERGSSIEQAVQTFVNAGYDITDVKDSASEISANQPAIPSTIPSQTSQPAQPQPTVQPPPQPRAKPTLQPIQIPSQTSQPAARQKVIFQPVGKSKSNIFLILAIIILVLIIFLLLGILLKDKIIEIVNSLFPIQNSSLAS